MAGFNMNYFMNIKNIGDGAKKLCTAEAVLKFGFDWDCREVFVIVSYAKLINIESVHINNSYYMLE